MIHLHGMEAVTANSDDTVAARTQLLSPHARKMPTKHIAMEGTLTHRLLENSAAAAAPKSAQPFPKEEPPKKRKRTESVVVAAVSTKSLQAASSRTGVASATRTIASASYGLIQQLPAPQRLIQQLPPAKRSNTEDVIEQLLAMLSADPYWDNRMRRSHRKNKGFLHDQH